MPRVRLFENACTFLDVVGPLYEAEEAKHNLMLGLAMRLCSERDSQADKPLMATVSGIDGNVLCSALRTPPFPLLVQCEPESVPVLESLVDVLVEREERLPGVNGVVAASDAFAVAWSERTHQNAVLNKHLRVYQLGRLQPPNAPLGGMRAARPAEAQEIANMLTAMQEETVGDEHEEWNAVKVLKAMETRAVYVWEAGGGPVCLTMAVRPTRRGICISGVYTPPALRGHGYASALVAAVSARVLQQGKQIVYLFTDMANPTSNSIYQKIGYQPVCDYHQFSFAGPEDALAGED